MTLCYTGEEEAEVYEVFELLILEFMGRANKMKMAEGGFFLFFFQLIFQI